MNELHDLDAFRSVLAQYHLSEAAMAVLGHTKFVLLVGPTSSGRNTLITELVKTGYYHHVVSDTTRQIRMKDGEPIEKDGREYWFRSEAAMLQDLQSGKFIEAAIIHEQQVSGLSIRELIEADEAGQIAIKDIEPNGAATIHHLKPDAFCIFIVPPDFKTWIGRLRNRSDVPEDEIRRRLETAYIELQAAIDSDYYTFIMNDNLHEAVRQIDMLVREGIVIAEVQEAALAHARGLRDHIRAYLDHERGKIINKIN